MPYAKRIVLNCPNGYNEALNRLVEDFLRDGVDLVAVAGRDYSRIEDIVDELVVGRGEDPSRFLVTTSHESLDEAIAFANQWTPDEPTSVQVVEI